MRAENYLCLGGVELGNALRTLTYLRRGLGGRTWEVHLANHDVGGCNTTVTIEGDVYEDTYSDTYGGEVVTTTVCDDFWPGNLACYCADLDEGPYVDPATDEAPWYSPDRPASGDFLGFIPANVDVRPTLSRASSQLVRGALIGPQSAGGQIAAVDGFLYAASKAGMAYGVDWMRAQLADELCDTDRALRFLPACPSGDDLADWRSLDSVGLVDGPTIGQVDKSVPECVVLSCAFQVLSEQPFQLGDAVSLFDSWLRAGSETLLVTQGDELGDSALQITVEALATSTVTVAAYPTSGDTCPSIVVTPAWTWSASIPAGQTLLVDGVADVVRRYNPATGETLAGLDALTYTAPFHPPTLVRCSQLCLVVTVAGSVKLTVDQVARHL